MVVWTVYLSTGNLLVEDLTNHLIAIISATVYASCNPLNQFVVLEIRAYLCTASGDQRAFVGLAFVNVYKAEAWFAILPLGDSQCYYLTTYQDSPYNHLTWFDHLRVYYEHQLRATNS